MDDCIIRTTDLSFSFGKVRALSDISLNVPRGSIFGFLGPNGAGKTTMIKVLLGLLHTSPGKVHVFGMELHKHKLEILARTGAMVESPSLYPGLNGFENVDVIRILRGLPVSETRRVLEKTGILNDAHRNAAQYSTGMKQRLALAVAILGEPDLLILDEPMNGMDPSGMIEIREFLLQLNHEHGTTILLSSHILSEIEKLASHIGIIDRGVLKFQGSTAVLQQKVMGQRTLSVSTNDDMAAIDLLRSKGIIVLAEGRGLKVRASGNEETAQIIRILVEGGLEVYEVMNEIGDLEDLFINVLRN